MNRFHSKEVDLILSKIPNWIIRNGSVITFISIILIIFCLNFISHSKLVPINVLISSQENAILLFPTLENYSVEKKYVKSGDVVFTGDSIFTIFSNRGSRYTELAKEDGVILYYNTDSNILERIYLIPLNNSKYRISAKLPSDIDIKIYLNQQVTIKLPIQRKVLNGMITSYRIDTSDYSFIANIELDLNDPNIPLYFYNKVEYDGYITLYKDRRWI